MTSEEALKTKILGRLDLSREVEDEELQELIFCVLEEESAVEYIPLEEKARLGKELFNAFRKLDLLQELIEDDRDYRGYDQWSAEYICRKAWTAVSDGQAFCISGQTG